VLRCFAPLPQRLVNVRFAGPSPLKDDGVQAEIRAHRGSWASAAAC
jgi:phosphoglucosamine mutase